ncbi:branched-chain amino acid aminotransferase [Aquimarina amphilecti]|uniref:Branched-chain-amino-acid aminotransferase n=1 Tax=Aquimarina amphilecti TaxID=1038014 RepID=A0A1H7SB68_AQUAM|nr:branched-chain amino acid aminotransferase [Aquimarina amphilecti]SEL69466.1 branched-chain amino acid aminotransferase [Aquimarina amphilecti]
MEQQIKITKTANSKLKDIDFDNIPLGTTFTDHMFICEYKNGSWNNPRVEPLELIPTHPAAMALHYGQAIFEGMKATVGNENTPLLFRPEENAKRFNHSAARLGMPSVPVDLFVEAVKQIVGVEHNWIPPQDGSALYLRPFMYADEPFIGMRAATSYKFIVICSPAGPFFTKKIRLYAETEYIRAADGGTGEAKAAGNYAAAILPTEKAKAKGYDQVLWLDANEHKYIQEVGTMNIFFKIGGKFITPSTSGSILKGITRDSVISLLKDKGFEVEERPITIDELIGHAKEGKLEEAFGTGTAVAIAMIEAIGYKDEVLTLSNDNPVSQDVKNTLDGIKTQKIEDKFNWILPVSIEEKVG